MGRDHKFKTRPVETAKPTVNPFPSVLPAIPETEHRDFTEVPLGLGITAQIVWMTPAKAQLFLDTRAEHKQRSIKAANLKMLMAQLQGDFYILNGDTVVIDRDGNLINGQHRMFAIVKSGIPIWVIVIRGVDPAAYATIDGGSKRTGADALRSLGYIHPSEVASACFLIYRWERGDVYVTNIKAGSPAIVDVAQKHPGIIESVEFARGCRDVCGSWAIPAFCHYIARRFDRALADEFFTKLATGENLSKGDPALALRNYFVKNDVSPLDTIAVITKAWNFARKGRQLEKLQLGKSEAYQVFK